VTTGGKPAQAFPPAQPMSADRHANHTDHPQPPAGHGPVSSPRERREAAHVFLACHQQAARPPASIPAGHHPSASTRNRPGPGTLRYFPAVPLGDSGAPGCASYEASDARRRTRRGSLSTPLEPRPRPRSSGLDGYRCPHSRRIRSNGCPTNLAYVKYFMDAPSLK
jgi:hypothetical protein